MGDIHDFTDEEWHDMSRVVDKNYIGDTWASNHIKIQSKIEASFVEDINLSDFFTTDNANFVHIKKHPKSYSVFLLANMLIDDKMKIGRMVGLLMNQEFFVKGSSAIRIEHNVGKYNREITFSDIQPYPIVHRNEHPINNSEYIIGFNCRTYEVKPLFANPFAKIMR